MSNSWNDKATAIRKGEALPMDTLIPFLHEFLGTDSHINVTQFPSGFSNLTYLIQTQNNEYVLRRPPFGANIKSGHDMQREYDILSALKPNYEKVPTPILFSDDLSIMQAPFYLMERVEGVIIRAGIPPEMQPNSEQMSSIASAFLDTMVELHALDVSSTGLQFFGKPTGYVRRQIEGWIRRYNNAKTDDITSIESASKWLLENMPSESNQVSLIHNDFKYDNLVLDTNDWSKVRAVLDWEMATTGDPLMDLGTTLGYWVNENDPDFIKKINLNPTTLPGNFTREDLVQQYALKSGRSVDEILFYYVYGLFKISGIIQQIYFRYKKGLTKDKRFESLLDGVKALGQMASQAISKKQIDNLF